MKTPLELVPLQGAAEAQVQEPDAQEPVALEREAQKPPIHGPTSHCFVLCCLFVARLSSAFLFRFFKNEKLVMEFE